MGGTGVSGGRRFSVRLTVVPVEHAMAAALPHIEDLTSIVDHEDRVVGEAAIGQLAQARRRHGAAGAIGTQPPQPSPLCQRSCRTAGAEPVGLNTNGGEQSTAT